MPWIEDIHEGDHIIGHYLCREKQRMVSKSGKSYYSIVLQDKTGTLNAKIWDLTSQIENFSKNQVIKIDANVTSFQGELQANVVRLRPSRGDEYQLSDYLKQTSKDVRQLYAQILSMIDSMNNEYLRRLLQSFFTDDPEFARKFQQHPAAKSVHHNYMGGLIEHVSSVFQIACFVAGLYDGVDMELVSAGALLHDIGKLDEITDLPASEYTDAGQMLGHIMLGYSAVLERIRMIPGFPQDLAEKLLHIIVSHHGELEFGSPKTPMTREAMIVHFADDIDAKLKLMESAVEEDRAEGRWTAFNRLLNRPLYKEENRGKNR